MLNKAIFMGRLVRDPELRTTQNGTFVTNFSVAVERDRTDASGAKVTDYIDCVAWRQTAEFVCKYFKKGQSIVVEGRLAQSSWTDKNGNSRTSLEIDVSQTWFGAPKAAVTAEDLPADADGLPF